jgi:hypothetical protein
MLGLFILIGVLVGIPTIALSIATFKLISLLGNVNGVEKQKASPFFIANEPTRLEKMVDEVMFRLDECYERIARLEEQVYEPVPDQHSVMPDSVSEDFSDEIYGDTPETLINPELLEKNRSHDEKIERLKAELEAYQAGVYDVPHEEIDRRYQPKPEHEYTE